MSRKDAIRILAKDFVKFVQKEEQAVAYQDFGEYESLKLIGEKLRQCQNAIEIIKVNRKSST